MKQDQFNVSDIILYLILILIIVAGLSGIFIEDLYRDNLLVRSAWYGNDLITIILAVPIFIVSIMLYKKKEQYGILLLLSMLFYSFYNYAFYLFGAALNDMYLVYAAIFTLSIFTILMIVRKINVEEIAEKFRGNIPNKIIGGYMLLIAIFLGVFHITLSLSYVFSGEVPQIIINTAHPTNVIAALDLSMVIPIALIGAVKLYKKEAWGYALAVIWNFKGFVYMAALSSATVVSYMNGATKSLFELFLWVPISIGCLIVSYILLKNYSAD